MLQGRDVCSIRVMVPDSRGLDQNFHNVTIVNIGVGCFDTGVVVAPPAVATCGPLSHGVATAGPGGDACGSQATIPADSAE